jgi:hypothetical protein
LKNVLALSSVFWKTRIHGGAIHCAGFAVARVTALAAAPNSAGYVLAITRTSYAVDRGRDRQVEPQAAVAHALNQIAVAVRLRTVYALCVARQKAVSSSRLWVGRA